MHIPVHTLIVKSLNAKLSLIFDSLHGTLYIYIYILESTTLAST